MRPARSATLLLFSLSLLPAGSQKPSKPPVATTAPRLILVMRHGEKPPKSTDDPNINETGRLRASRLSTLFLPAGKAPARFPHPDFLFATARSKNSNRPAETAAPLGVALHETVNLDFGKDDNKALAHEVLSGKYAGKVVVIIWHHGAIPALMHDLGVVDPPKWQDETFDQIWEVDYNDGAAHMSTAPEMLLPGDSNR